jgi:hypothetical protein
MATYKKIQAYIKQHYGYSCKTCWIAHMKEVCGLELKQAYNRQSSDHRKNPCPDEKQQNLINAFKHFKMI